eukprot:2355507-Rhodomonas_salina.1
MYNVQRCYARATRCAVLTERMVLWPGCGSARRVPLPGDARYQHADLERTVISAYAPATKRPVLTQQPAIIPG